MKWQPGQQSDDIEDRRGEGDGGGGGGGGGGFGGFGGSGGGFRLGGTHLGVGGLLIVAIALYFGRSFLNGGGTRQPGPAHGVSHADDQAVAFVSFVLDDAQKTWAGIFQQRGMTYRHAKLVLYTRGTRSGCGHAESATGPFYCPADEKIYIDLSFFHELSQRFGAPGDFAQAYVIAHELGHHVQKLIGIEADMARLAHSRPARANALSVEQELQADCFAGVWGHSTQQRQLLDPGDVDEGLGAAAAVGDDRLQKAAGNEVTPETFTHGSSAQRVSWFRKGFDGGRMEDCTITP